MTNIDSTTLWMRRALGIMGMLLPITDLAFGLFTGTNSISYFASISATHHSSSYLLFEGLVFATGMFLVCYNGYGDKVDFWLTFAAGIGAILLTLFPCTVEGAEVRNFLMLPMSITNVVHLIGAATFFGCLFWLIEFQFTKTGPSPTHRKQQRNMFYKICGWVMLGGIVFGFGSDLFFGQYWNHFVYLGEFIALEAFGMAWMTKGSTFLKDLS
jgi:hypothetical protein